MQKCSAAKLKSINARNDYILNLSAANALFKAYFETEIPELLSVCPKLNYLRSFHRLCNVILYKYTDF